LLGWVEQVDIERDGTRSARRIPMLGHARLDHTPPPTSRAGRDAARSAARSIADRRRALALDLTAVLGAVKVGDAVTYDADGTAVTFTRPAPARYAIDGAVVDMGGHAATPAAVAVKLARRLVTA
jgi:hypothetical protein